MERITFVVPSRNNLEFLNLCYAGLRNLKTKHDILFLNDASTDGTKEWLESLDDDCVHVYENPGPERIGIVGMVDKGIEMARTDIICAYHADMVAGPDLDKYLLENLKPKTVVTAPRVEPPLHPAGHEKIIYNHGIEVDEFNMEAWLKWCSDNIDTDKTTEGIFAPWCLYKQDFVDLGGHDKLFAPQSKEDSDLFNRMHLAGYKFVQTWSGLVYHFTSRGSRFNKHSGGAAGQDSKEWQHTTTVNGRNFLRKWGRFVNHDEYLKPIVSSRYDIGLCIHNCQTDLIKNFEPMFDNIFVDCEYASYVDTENARTPYDVGSRVSDISQEPQNDIVITIDCQKLTTRMYEILTVMSDVIDTATEPGEFKLEDIHVKINKLEKKEVQNYALSYHDAG